MSTPVLRRIWHGFTRLFGLDTCAPAPPSRRETPEQRRVRERLQARLDVGGRARPRRDADADGPARTP